MTLQGMHIGRYRLQRLIGSGGMGEVYLAEDSRIARKVAIKVMKNEADVYPDVQATQDATRLFEREMKAITTLDHPNILPLFDFGEETIHKTTLTYMVMPFRTEGSLLDWLHQPGNASPLSPQQVMHIIRQAADALQHAHNRHLMHLDIKPSNFLLRHREDPSGPPDVLLADFGIAKFTTATATVSQSIRGTPAYMAPEQWAGTPSAATDQYALAIMTYQLLTGRLPFRGSMQQVMYQHLQEQPQAPSAMNPHIPVTVDTVILRALAKKAEDRFTSIQAFATAFEQAWKAAIPSEQPELSQTEVETIAPPQPGQSRQASTDSPPSDPTEASSPPATPSVIPVPSPRKRPIPRIAIIFGLLALCVVVGGTAIVLFHPAHLKSSYSGTETAQAGSDPLPMTLVVSSQDLLGNVSGTVTLEEDHIIQGAQAIVCSFRGTVSVNHITVTCESQYTTSMFDGTIYPDGHIEGVQKYVSGYTISFTIR
jgi:serine/threonine protein kinase